MSIYDHYKGGVYIKLEEAEHSETGETLVIYQCVTTGKIYARPKEMFYGDVSKEDYEGKRFVKREEFYAKEIE